MSLHGSLGDLSISILSCLMMLLLWLVIECDGNNRRAFLQSAGNDRKAWFYVQMCMCSISACICAIIYAHIITHRYMMIHAYKEINEVVGLNGWIVISCCFNHDVHPCEHVFPMSSPWIIVYININIHTERERETGYYILYVYIYTYIYMCVCACVCACVIVCVLYIYTHICTPETLHKNI